MKSCNRDNVPRKPLGSRNFVATSAWKSEEAVFAKWLGAPSQGLDSGSLDHVQKRL